MSSSVLKSLRSRLRIALDATPWGGRKIQARRARRAQVDRSTTGPFAIDLPDLTGSGLRPVYLEQKSRYATVTSVRLLDHETLVCASFLEKKLYLIRFDLERRTHRILDTIATTYGGMPVETDLADVDATGEFIALSNFHHGSLTLYRREGERLAYVRDLDFDLDSKVHGVKFVRPDLVAVTVGSGPTGIRFFDLELGRPTVHFDLPHKTQDLAFLSEREMIVLAVHGAPTRKRQAPYGSDVFRVEFDLETELAKIGKLQTWENAHFDACVLHKGQLFLTDQRNDCVKVLDPESLALIEDIGGYDFPHGIDIGWGMLAVTNYGTNSIELRSLPV